MKWKEVDPGWMESKRMETETEWRERKREREAGMSDARMMRE